MGKFNKTGKRGMPTLNTSSLPDLIFTLLFFFMIVTTMREVSLKVEFKIPQGTELEKLEKKSLVTFIYVGKPTAEFRKKLGSESRIQLNDAYAEVDEIQAYVTNERSSMKEEDQPFMTVSLKIDQDTKMGIVTDIKQALRQAYALNSTHRKSRLIILRRLFFMGLFGGCRGFRSAVLFVGTIPFVKLCIYRNYIIRRAMYL